MTMTRCSSPANTPATPLMSGVQSRLGASGEGADLPEGVIAPYSWEGKDISMTGQGGPGTAAVDEAVQQAMRAHGIVGCGVCVIRGDTVIHSKGFGMAELPDLPFLEDCATRCGSLAKPVTALAALLLADMGSLGLDEAVCPILEARGMTPAPVGSSKVDPRVGRITVRHLMDHTSGLPRSATYTAWRPERNVAAVQGLNDIATAADVARDCLGNATLTAEPGERYEYANANFVLLARVIEARSTMPFGEFLTTVAMPRFGLAADDIYVSRNQMAANSPDRGINEPAYYQTGMERYVSFVPSECADGQIYGEAYRGYATAASDGAGGLACTAHGLGKIIANLNSPEPAISQAALSAIVTPPAHYLRLESFDPEHSPFYSKGFGVRFSEGQPWFSHGGMTMHCGGVIGHNAGHQFVAVSNWNNTESPYVDAILGGALSEVMPKLT